MQRDHKYDLTVGDTAVSIRKRGSSRIRTAQILGAKDYPDGSTTIWLDRLVCKDGMELNPEWSASGVISTALTKRPIKTQS